VHGVSLVRAWLAAIGVYVAGELVLSVVLFTVRPPLTDDPDVALLWGALPSLIIYAAMAAAAALLHRGHGRGHWATVLSVPAVALAGSTVLSLTVADKPDYAALTATVAASVAGTVAGWQAMDRFRPRRSDAPNPYGT